LLKIAEEQIVNAKETLLVPSVKGEAIELEEDLKPIEIQFDEIQIEDVCNSEGALECRDMLEIDAIELGDVGRSSENGRMMCRSPEPRLEEASDDND
jgi:hypothetical protein